MTDPAEGEKSEDLFGNPQTILYPMVPVRLFPKAFDTLKRMRLAQYADEKITLDQVLAEKLEPFIWPCVMHLLEGWAAGEKDEQKEQEKHGEN
jgi:hypothetical protein